MKKITFSVSTVGTYRELVIGTPEHEFSDDYTIWDVFAHFDKKYFDDVRPTLDENQRKKILMAKDIKSLLQLIYNPQENTIYEDCMLQARRGFSERELLPIFEDLDYELPDGAYISVGADIGC